MTPAMQYLGAGIFALALIHTFSAKWFERLAHKGGRHAGVFDLLGEVEVVFGFWAFVLVATMAFVMGSADAIAYAESRQYTEPLFVFVVMVIAASRPILSAMASLVRRLGRTSAIQAWLCLAVVPLAGSLITEPAAMTLAALLLSPIVFRPDVPERIKYFALGVLFVNISIGGTLTSYAAPPVLMVAKTWGWDSAFMLQTFGWKATLAVIVNATIATWLVKKYLVTASDEAPGSVPAWVSAVHLAMLAGVVVMAHHPVFFLGIFMLFLGFATAYQRYQSPLILKEGLLVAFFLAGLVVLGGMQQWWLQPLVSSLEPLALFFGALGLTAITDNAALTYLGSLITGLSPEAKYMLMAGAVGGGGLTVIANAPNPAGVALLRNGFEDQSVGVAQLFVGALLPTAVAAAFLLM